MNLLFTLLLVTSIYLPFASKPYTFYEGGAINCKPNAGITYVNGTVFKGPSPINGSMVVFSTQPDGPIIASIQAGPHPGYESWPTGFFSHILSATGPRAGTWYFWIVDAFNQRMSVIVTLITTAVADPNGCQQARIFFRMP